MQPKPLTRTWQWSLLAAAMLLTFVQTAWICEDAFITLRTVDFALQGHGLVWNIGERVQAYTHPLWLMLLIPWRYLAGDPYMALITLSLSCSAGAMYVIKLTRTSWPLHSIVGVASLMWSRAFVDYSSSGLENPLTHLLLAAFLLTWLRSDTPKKGLWLTLICSAMYTNRPDSILLVLPALGWHFLKTPKVGQAMLGALPAIGWTLFSLVYYGSSVPNTALSKVATGLSLWSNAAQAGHYVEWTLHNDPLTLIIIVMTSSTTSARPTSPHFGSGTPITAHWLTGSRSAITLSTSAG